MMIGGSSSASFGSSSVSGPFGGNTNSGFANSCNPTSFGLGTNACGPNPFGPATGTVGGRGLALPSDRANEVTPDYSNQFNDLNTDVLGEDNDDDGNKTTLLPKQTAFGFGPAADSEEAKKVPYMFFDFRRGKDSWPANVKLIDAKQADILLEKAALATDETVEVKKKDDQEDDDSKEEKDNKDTKGNKESKSSEGYNSSACDDNEATENQSTIAPPDAVFETLKDGSYALVIQAGYRLKLNLSELLEGGDDKKAEREAEKRKKKLQEKYASKWYAGNGGFADYGHNPKPSSGGSGSGRGAGMDDLNAWGAGKKKGKGYINKYTITMDVKLMEEPPREGISLFQTALIHKEENKRTGKTILKRSDGECLVNAAGGVGMFGTYGDTTKARLVKGVWKRVVIAVKCGLQTGEKGEMRTWIGTEPGVVLKEDTIVANERFTLDPENLFLFSSKQPSMMPGELSNILLHNSLLAANIFLYIIGCRLLL
jgi:hypothetical protein